MQNGSIIPIFRIFDIELARSFYLDYLGFQIDWQHTFGITSLFIYKFPKMIVFFIYLNILVM